MRHFTGLMYFLLMTWKQEVYHRKEFLLRFFLTAANSLTLFAFWLVYTSKFNDINGWSIKQIAVLYATTHLVMGLVGMFGIGSLDLAFLFQRGQISRELSDPGFAMARLLARGSSFQSFSSVILGIAYFAWSGYLTGLAPLLGVFLVSLIGALIFILFFASLNSLVVRWLDGQVLADQVYEVALLFMMYPKNLFYGVIESICLFIVPVFWMVHVPAELVISPSMGSLLQLLLVAGISNVLAFFSLRSLKRYVFLVGD